MAALSPAQAPVARGPLRCIGAPESSNPRQTMVVGSLIAARLGAAAHVAPAALHAALDGSGQARCHGHGNAGRWWHGTGLVGAASRRT